MNEIKSPSIMTEKWTNLSFLNILSMYLWKRTINLKKSPRIQLILAILKGWIWDKQPLTNLWQYWPPTNWPLAKVADNKPYFWQNYPPVNQPMEKLASGKTSHWKIQPLAKLATALANLSSRLKSMQHCRGKTSQYQIQPLAKLFHY